MMVNQVAGTKIQIDLTLQDEAEAPQDLTGAKLTWRISRAYSVPGILVKDSDTITGVVFKNPPGVDGLVTVILDPDDTLDMQGGYFHSIKADWGGNSEKTWQLGSFSFGESIVGAD